MREVAWNVEKLSLVPGVWKHIVIVYPLKSCWTEIRITNIHSFLCKIFKWILTNQRNVTALTRYQSFTQPKVCFVYRQLSEITFQLLIHNLFVDLLYIKPLQKAFKLVNQLASKLSYYKTKEEDYENCTWREYRNSIVKGDLASRKDFIILNFLSLVAKELLIREENRCWEGVIKWCPWE